MKTFSVALALLLATVTLAGQSVMPVPRIAFYDNNGDPCAGCLLHVFAAGTNTEQNTYTDPTLATANKNPIELDSAGRATVFLDARLTYKFTLSTAADVPIWTVDSVDAVPSALNVEVSGVAGETLAQRQIVYLSSGLDATVAGRWYLTDADVVSKSSGATLVGVVISPAIVAASSGTIRIQGRVSGFSGLSEGLTYFVSATAGALTSVAPAQVKVVGVAESPTTLLLTPSAASSGGVGAFSSLQVSSTAVNSIDTAGGIEAGTGNVQVVDATGKIPAIDATRFASLSGANLTALNATQLTSGTIPESRIPTTLAQTYTLQSANTLSNGIQFTGVGAAAAGKIGFNANQLSFFAGSSGFAWATSGGGPLATLSAIGALTLPTSATITADAGSEVIRLRGRVADDVGQISLQTNAGVTQGAIISTPGNIINRVGGVDYVFSGAQFTVPAALSVAGAQSGFRINSHSAQPGFLVVNSVDRAFGDTSPGGATITLDTEIYDTGGGFAANVYTAPVTGIYHLSAQVFFSVIGLTAEVYLDTSNRSYRLGLLGTAIGNFSGSVYADMDAGDTASLRVITTDSVNTMAGSLSPYVTWFSGRLSP